MKIIRGTLKRRIIVCSSQIRPVSELVRKACFDILGDEVRDKRILDLFAGSGALGMEALSAGAASAVFVDHEGGCVSDIRKNLAVFGLEERSQVYLKDSFSAIHDFKARNQLFDLIFIDPPYYQAGVKKALQLLGQYDILAALGYAVCFSYSKDEQPEPDPRFSLIVDKNYGQTSLLIYRKET
jgi:16S rRNA (guanine(966)-N(2))-methyltransferase RsmD